MSLGVELRGSGPGSGTAELAIAEGQEKGAVHGPQPPTGEHTRPWLPRQEFPEGAIGQKLNTSASFPMASIFLWLYSTPDNLPTSPATPGARGPAGILVARPL